MSARPRLNHARSLTTRAVLALARCAALALVVVSGCREKSVTDAMPAPAPVEALSERLSARVALDRAELTTAQSLSVTLTVRTAPGFQALPVDWTAALGEAWTLRSERAASDTTSTDGTRTRVLRVEIDPFLPGESEFPSLTISAAPNDGAPRQSASVVTPQVPVIVRSVLSDGDTALAPSRGVVEPGFTVDWPLIGIATGAVGVVAAGLVLLARRAAHEARRRFAQLAPADAVATARLARLAPAAPQAAGDADAASAHLSALSWVLRRYIEDRFALRAPERTTEEFLAEARGSPAIAPDDLVLLAVFLRECDLVKFAGARATAGQIEHAAELVNAFVARTRDESALVVLDESEGLSVDPARVTRRERTP